MKKTYKEAKNNCKKKIEKEKKTEKKTEKKKQIEKKIKKKIEYKKGDRILHIKTNIIGYIEQIHYDDIVPYYTISMKNGREIQTTKEKLKVI